MPFETLLHGLMLPPRYWSARQYRPCPSAFAAPCWHTLTDTTRTSATARQSNPGARRRDKTRQNTPSAVRAGPTYAACPPVPTRLRRTSASGGCRAVATRDVVTRASFLGPTADPPDVSWISPYLDMAAPLIIHLRALGCLRRPSQ
jgi:hypothetical protein